MSAWNCLPSRLSASGMVCSLVVGDDSVMGGSCARGPPHGGREAVLGQRQHPGIDPGPAAEGVVIGRPVRRGRARWSARSGRWRGRRCPGRDAGRHPTPASIAAPSAVDSLTSGTCTVTSRASATMRGHSWPFAAPPVNTMESTVCPVSSSMMARWPRDANAACSWTARMQARRSVRAWIADIEAHERGWRLDPALDVHDVGEDGQQAVGTRPVRRPPASSMTTYASTPRRAASARSGSHSASRSQRMDMPP